MKESRDIVGDEDLVSNAIDAIVEHFRQPIHAPVEEPPYFFDSEDPPELPPVIRYWTYRFEQENLVSALSIFYIIQAYPKSIRPSLLVSNKIERSGIAVLRHYELLLHQCLTVYKQKGGNEIQQETLVDLCLLSETLNTMACDLTRSTAVPNKSEKAPSAYLISNVVAPTLIQLICHVLSFCSDCASDMKQDVIRRCSVSVLAFGMPHIEPRQVDSSLEDRLLFVSQYMAHSPKVPLEIHLSGMNWEALELDGTYWDDPVVGVASRLAQRFWTLLNKTRQGQENIMECMEQLDIEKMAHAVRAHFFGRDMPKSETALAKPLTRLHLGRTVPYQAESDEMEKPYQLIPSRVHVVLHFVSLLDTVTNGLLDSLLPICYELVNGSDDTAIIGLGAAALFHLFQCPAPENVWSPFADNLVALLLEAVKLCPREGPTMALLGLAQHELFQKLSGSQYIIWRRKATQQWLMILEKNRFQTSDPLVWGLLVGGVVPFLYDHAGRQNADALELGRVGLMAILPLMRHGSGTQSEEIRLAALVALLNLLISAYPIMPHHGGKIMCELLAFMGHLEDQKSSQIMSLARYVAAVAVAICGDRAEDVLDRVCSQDKYSDRLVALAQRVRKEAENVREQS